jgi:hypothetical protein
MFGDIGTACRSCHSSNQNVFNGEVAIHFPGLEGVNKPIVWAFPKLTVCLDCGFSEFSVPERELRVLSLGSPVEGALVWPKAISRMEKAG